MKCGGNQASFQESYPSGITQDTLTFFQHPMGHGRSVVCEGSTLQTQCPRFLLRLVTQAPLPIMYRNSRLPERKEILSINILFTQFRYIEALLSVREWQKPSPNQVPRYWPRVSLACRPKAIFSAHTHISIYSSECSPEFQDHIFVF